MDSHLTHMIWIQQLEGVPGWLEASCVYETIIEINGMKINRNKFWESEEIYWREENWRCEIERRFSIGYEIVEKIQ